MLRAIDEGSTFRRLEHEAAARIDRPDDVPNEELGFDPRNLWTPHYGLTRFSDLFTNRQLVALTTFCDLIPTVRERIVADGGSLAYANAITTYLGLALSKATDMNNSLVNWKPSMDQAINLFKRQAIPMAWDYPETPPLSEKHGGGYLTSLNGIAKVLESLVPSAEGQVEQADASTRSYAGVVISTDPPYYDNIDYSDLSDFFYVWLRKRFVPYIPICCPPYWCRRRRSWLPTPTGTTERKVPGPSLRMDSGRFC